MDVSIFSAHAYDRTFLEAANQDVKAGHVLHFHETHLTADSAPLAKRSQAVCTFVNDKLGQAELNALARCGIRLVALRCAGFNQVDLEAAAALNIQICRVPAYSPDAIAEHAAALILSLSRRIHKAYARVREGNFALEGLLGFDLHDKTVGVIGTGKIGQCLARIMAGFGCRILAYDPCPTPVIEEIGGTYVPLDTLITTADVISLHCPLTPQTRHLINRKTLATMKHGVMLINTSRGAVMDARALISGLKTGQIGYLGLDVYEEEENLFFQDMSEQVIRDDVFARLNTFPNVLITGHQGFFTQEAMTAIARTTIRNLTAFEQTGLATNQVPSPKP